MHDQMLLPWIPFMKPFLFDQQLDCSQESKLHKITFKGCKAFGYSQIKPPLKKNINQHKDKCIYSSVLGKILDPLDTALKILNNYVTPQK